MIEGFFICCFFIALTGAVVTTLRSIMLPPNHPYNVKRRKQNWLDDHPDERWKCPYK